MLAAQQHAQASWVKGAYKHRQQWCRVGITAAAAAAWLHLSADRQEAVQAVAVVAVAVDGAVALIVVRGGVMRAALCC